jgi:4-carboxymuconolactone decarboxylase
MTDDAYDRGMRVRRAVLGDEYVERARGAVTPLTEDFQDLLTRYAWGEVWGRPGLDKRTRSCVTIALLAALGHQEELALHLRGGLNNGLTNDEIKEVLLHVAIYAGIPAANTAFRLAREVLG